jgi:hypothetical protein
MNILMHDPLVGLRSLPAFAAARHRRDKKAGHYVPGYPFGGMSMPEVISTIGSSHVT